MERLAYTVHARRGRRDDWWIDIDGVRGLTQAKSFDEVAEMAGDLIHLKLDMPADSFDLVVERRGNLRRSEIKPAKGG